MTLIVNTSSFSWLTKYLNGKSGYVTIITFHGDPTHQKDTVYHGPLLITKTAMKHGAIRITLIYIICGLLWIYYSDALMIRLKLYNDLPGLVFISNTKGFIYVLVTGFILFYLIRHYASQIKFDFAEIRAKDAMLKDAVERYEYAALATEDMLYDYQIQDNKLSYSQAFGHFSHLRLDADPDPASAWLALIHPEDLERVIDTNRFAMLQVQDKYECDYRVCVGQNNYRYVHDQAHLIYNEDNLPVRMIGAIRDMQDWKTACDDNRQLDELINKVHNMVLITDVNRNVKWVNKSFEKFTGYVLADIAGKQPVDILAGNNPNWTLIDEIIYRSTTQDCFSMELPLYTRKKEKYWVFADFTPIYDSRGEYSGYAIIYTDITTLKSKEQSLLQQNALLRELTWRESHEVRKPLASILSLTSLLAETNDPAEQKEMLQYIDVSAKELDKMICSINDRLYEVACANADQSRTGA